MLRAFRNKKCEVQKHLVLPAPSAEAECPAPDLKVAGRLPLSALHVRRSSGVGSWVSLQCELCSSACVDQD